MHSFKKILVPIDFSSNSKEAVEVALSMAGRYGASLMLIYVYQSSDYGPPDGFHPYAPTQVNELLASLDSQLETAKKDAQAAAGALSVSSMILHGHVASEIVRCAREENFDLIVMGTHGRTGSGHALLGAVVERVLRTAPCPVLAVRTDPD